MIKNYFVVAIRNLMRKKLYTFINVFGLGLGLACCILMALFVKHEWSRDRFHENHDQMFRLVAQRVQSDGKAISFNIWDTVHLLWVVDALKDEIPDIEQTCAFMQAKSRWTKITRDEKTFPQDIGIVSTNFFQMFTFPLLVGDPETVLTRPDGMVITENIARKFFGDVQNYSALIGQTLAVKNRQFVVTGIMADVPTTSSLQFDALVSTKAEKGFMLARGIGVRAWIFVQIGETNASRVVDDLNHWSKKEKLQEEIFKNKPFNFILQPLTDVYWNTDIPNHYGPQGNPTGVYILWGLAWLVLLIACSNFISLSVAESSGRAKEVGLRKVVGANRGQIIQQFWSEALVLSFLGLLVGTALTEILLPVFNGFVHQKLTLAYFDDWWVLLLLLGIVGLIAGSYPALVLSRFQPVLAMKGEARPGGRNLLTRTLLTLQYAASIALIIGTGVMIQQQDYVRNKNLGFNEEHVAIIKTNRQLAKPYKEAIVNDSRIAGVTITDRTLTTESGYSWSNYSLPDGSIVEIKVIGVDVDYLSTLEIPLLAGRNFSEDHPSDLTKSVLINETLAKKLGVENPVGETLAGFGRNGVNDPVVIGIVRDFHIKSLHNRIEPLALLMEKYNYGPFLLIRMRPGQIFETIGMLKNTWKKVAPNMPFELSFLDENLNRQYANEVYWFRVLSHSALVAVLLSCLGLFGLASLAVARRTKEIGIRKVLGASVHHVMWLFSRDFIKLLLVANIIAYPVAYWMMNQWLTNFAYRIELGIGVFGIAGILTLIVALLTVNFQTLKAARRNPVDALRDE
ncbi:MAG: FtsX-like permease family protein [Gemmatimonadetes bacterium]|nr:FtsX-like permease family protein [Gemmatimonadota bacterium]